MGAVCAFDFKLNACLPLLLCPFCPFCPVGRAPDPLLFLAPFSRRLAAEAARAARGLSSSSSSSLSDSLREENDIRLFLFGGSEVGSNVSLKKEDAGEGGAFLGEEGTAWRTGSSKRFNALRQRDTHLGSPGHRILS